MSPNVSGASSADRPPCVGGLVTAERDGYYPADCFSPPSTRKWWAMEYSPPIPPPGDDLLARMAIDLREIELTRMPFGKFGPKAFPPMGTPIYDLPVEYLGWFERKANWPRGRLGELLKMVYHMKADGSDVAFDPMRRRAGGKAPLRPPKPPRHIHFDELPLD